MLTAMEMESKIDLVNIDPINRGDSLMRNALELSGCEWTPGMLRAAILGDPTERSVRAARAVLSSVGIKVVVYKSSVYAPLAYAPDIDKWVDDTDMVIHSYGGPDIVVPFTYLANPHSSQYYYWRRGLKHRKNIADLLTRYIFE